MLFFLPTDEEIIGFILVQNVLLLLWGEQIMFAGKSVDCRVPEQTTKDMSCSGSFLDFPTFCKTTEQNPKLRS